VTLTARLANGGTRTRVGKLTVLSGAATGTGPVAWLKLTTVLPRGLSAAVACRKGIAELFGATVSGPARAQLFQGSGTKPKAPKRVPLRVPGPVRVILKSGKLKRGAFRIVVRTDDRVLLRRGCSASSPGADGGLGPVAAGKIRRVTRTRTERGRTGPNALVVNCTRKPAPEESTEALARVVVGALATKGVTVEMHRALDYDIRPGVSSGR
jgi:hypothetical protein